MRHRRVQTYMVYRRTCDPAFRSMIAIGRRLTNRGRVDGWASARIRRIPKVPETFPTNIEVAHFHKPLTSLLSPILRYMALAVAPESHLA